MFGGTSILYNAVLKKGKERNESNVLLSRKIYLSYPTAIFNNYKEIEFEILNSIANKFDIPFNSIQIIGSAKTGSSYISNEKFVKGKSDLDVAIINQSLFTKYLKYAYEQTKGYSDLSTFHNMRSCKAFKEGIVKGYLNPYYLPAGDLKDEWFNYFKTHLSSEYLDCFKNINAGIYTSMFFFESKQAKTIEYYLSEYGDI